MDLVDQYTGPAEKVMSSAGKMDTEFKELNDQLKKAGTIKADLNHFDALNRKLDVNSDSLSEARKESKRLGQEMAGIEKPTKKQILAFDKAKSSVSKLERSQTKYRKEITTMNAQMTKAGINTNKMSLAHRKADMSVKKLTKSLDRELKVLTDISLQQLKIDKYSAKAKNIRGSIGAGDIVQAGAGLYAVKKLAQEYGEIASAQGQLKSLGMDDADIEAVTNKAREFSSEFAGFNQSALISATYDLKSGMSNLSGEALAGYLEISATVAGGTKASIEQITGLMATGYGIYRDGFSVFGKETITGWEQLSKDEKDIKFGEYFGAGIAAAVQQFKTDGSQMTDAIKSIGKVAETSNVSMAEQLAILGMLQTTMSGSEAATKYKSFLNKAVLAGDKLGLSMTDQNNQLLSTVDIIGQLKSKYGETLDDMEKADLKKAFGSDEAMAYITLMYDKTDQLKENTDNLSSSMSRGRSVYGEMANAIMKGGPLESMQLLDQVTKNTMADLGYGFAPIIAKVAGVIGSASNVFGSFLRENQGFAEYIAIGTTALIALKIASIGSKFVMGGLFDVFAIGNKALLFWRTATLGAAAGTGLMTQAQLVFNAAMIANPIGMVIVGIAALIAIGYVLYKNWDEITQGMVAAFDFLGVDIVAIGEFMASALGVIFDGLMFVIMGPINAMKVAYEWASSLLSDDDTNAAIEVSKTFKTDSALRAPLTDQGLPGNLVKAQQITANYQNPLALKPSGLVPGNLVKAGNVSTHNNNKGGVTIESSDVYHFSIPETNDPEMVKRAVREELEQVNRNKARQAGQALYD